MYTIYDNNISQDTIQIIIVFLLYNKKEYILFGFKLY